MVEESDNEPVLTDEEIEALVEHAQEGGFDDGEFRIHDFSAGESLTISKWSELEGLHPIMRRPSVKPYRLLLTLKYPLRRSPRRIQLREPCSLVFLSACASSVPTLVPLKKRATF